MPKTITILNPKILEREKELVLLPKEEYESLVRIKTKGIPEVKLTESERRAIRASEKELAGGRYFTIDEFEKYLGRTSTKARR